MIDSLFSSKASKAKKGITKSDTILDIQNSLSLFSKQIHELSQMQKKSKSTYYTSYTSKLNSTKFTALELHTKFTYHTPKPPHKPSSKLQKLLTDFHLLISKFEVLEQTEETLSFKSPLPAFVDENYFTRKFSSSPSDHQTVSSAFAFQEEEKQRAKTIACPYVREIDCDLLQDQIASEEEEEDKQVVRQLSLLSEYSNQMAQMIAQGDYKLQGIQQNVEESNKHLKDGNKELKVCVSKYGGFFKWPKLKLGLILGGIGCAIGSVVPGAGNIAGAAVGSAIGVSIGSKIRRIEKKKIKQMDLEE